MTCTLALTLIVSSTPGSASHAPDCHDQHPQTAYTGGVYRDVFIGTSSDNVMVGLGGNDELWGRDGNWDYLCGNTDSDEIHGEDGRDWINSGDDNDGPVKGDNGDDWVYGGAGHDSDVRGQSQSDVVAGDKGNDEIYGGGGDDDLFPGQQTDLIWGGTEFDYFFFCQDDGGADQILDRAAGEPIDIIHVQEVAWPIWCL